MPDRRLASPPQCRALHEELGAGTGRCIDGRRLHRRITRHHEHSGYSDEGLGQELGDPKVTHRELDAGGRASARAGLRTSALTEMPMAVSLPTRAEPIFPVAPTTNTGPRAGVAGSLVT